MESLAFTVIALGIFGFGLVSKRVQTSVITPPMVFTALGFLIGPTILGLGSFEVEQAFIHTLAEITLILVLFTDASRIDLKVLRRERDIPERLLLIGMPLTILLGSLVGVLLFPNLILWEAAILAALLAPTDAALGQAVVSSRLVPVRIRQALNVESGLNDGIALPVILILIAAAGYGHGPTGSAYWLQFVGMQLLLGPLIGFIVGFAGGRLVEWGQRTEWMSHTFQQLAAIAIALIAYGGAELSGGNGFIAAFVAGLALGNFARSVCTCLVDFGEAQGQLLILLTFLIFGAVIVPEVLTHANAMMWLYAALSLTVVRLLPVSLSLLGLKLCKKTHLFLGWFGPRGLASILFGLLVLHESGLPAVDFIMATVGATVLLSILVHGMTAWPATQWYAARTEKMKSEEGAVPEFEAVTEMPVRVSHPQ